MTTPQRLARSTLALPPIGGQAMRRAAGRARGSAALALAGLVACLGLWSLIARSVDPVQLPPPGDVWTALHDGWTEMAALEWAGFQSGGIKAAITFTAVNVLTGVAIGAAAGFFVGLLIGASRRARALLGPPLFVAGTTPVLVILPFLLIWFGTARLAQSGLVIFFTFVTVSAVTEQAVGNVAGRWRDYAASLGASRTRIARSVVLPAVVPEVIGGIRVSAAAGWSFATVAELLGGQEGAGKVIQAMAQLQRTADIIAVVLALGALAVVLDLLITTIGRWVVRWQE